MRTNGEIAHDAQIAAMLRPCADALGEIAGTLAEIRVMVVNPKMASGPVRLAQQKKGGPDGKSE